MKDVRLKLFLPLGKIALLCTLLLASCSIVLAQVKFSGACPKSVAVNQNFQIDYTVENGSAKTLQPSFGDFQVLSGPNPTQQFQIMNGHMSQSVVYSYVLRPKKEGTYKIDKAKANIEGANMESNELSITVTGPVQQQAQQRRRDPFSDPFGDDDPFEQMRQMQQQQSHEGQ